MSLSLASPFPLCGSHEDIGVGLTIGADVAGPGTEGTVSLSSVAVLEQPASTTAPRAHAADMARVLFICPP